MFEGVWVKRERLMKFRKQMTNPQNTGLRLKDQMVRSDYFPH